MRLSSNCLPSERPGGNFSFLQQLLKRLHTTFYKLRLTKTLQDNDNPARCDFCIALQEELEDDGFDHRLVFSNEATFHANSNVNKHKHRMWCTKIPHECLEHHQDSPKIDRDLCYVFFEGSTFNSDMYLDILENCLMDKLREE